MRKMTVHELRAIEETLEYLKPQFDLEYYYDEDSNMCLIGDNYIIRGMTNYDSQGVETDYFKLIYGSNHPGDLSWDLERWEEEDIARASNPVLLLPLMVSNMWKRRMEDRIFSQIKLGYGG